MAKLPEYFHFRVVVSAKGTEVELQDESDHDFAEIVRCKDCYAYRKDTEIAKAAYLDPEYYCALLRCEFCPDGFCSYGRRADNG